VSLESCYLGWEVHARAARAARLEEKRQLGKLPQQDLDVMRAAEQRASDALQYEEAEEEYSRMSWEEDRIIKAVNAIPAKTEAGLRVRALAVCLSRIHSLSHPPSQLDWCDLAARRMLESFISVLGIAVANDLITTDTPEAA
jgi:hypothetical protein